jgi:hypothetical protein
MNKYTQLIEEIEKLTIPRTKKDSLIKDVESLKNLNTLHNPNFIINDSNKYKPKAVERGDLVTVTSGFQAHPGIVYKVNTLLDKVYVIGFTTNENYAGIVSEKFSSRFLKDSCLTASMQVMSMEEALRYWTGTFNNMTLANKLFQEFENYYINLIGKTKIKKKLI